MYIILLRVYLYFHSITMSRKLDNTYNSNNYFLLLFTFLTYKYSPMLGEGSTDSSTTDRVARHCRSAGSLAASARVFFSLWAWVESILSN